MKKILVVEDDMDIHNLIKNVLEKERYEVISAYSGTEAILLSEKNRCYNAFAFCDESVKKIA